MLYPCALVAISLSWTVHSQCTSWSDSTPDSSSVYSCTNSADSECTVSSDFNIGSLCEDSTPMTCIVAYSDVALDISEYVNDTAYCIPLSSQCSASSSTLTGLTQNNSMLQMQSYQCADPFVCDILTDSSSGATLIKADVQSSEFELSSDCYSNMSDIVTVSGESYLSCCSGDDCNDYAFSESDAVTDSTYSGMMSNMLKCSYGSTEWDCASDPCTLLIGSFATTFACQCASYASLYSRASADQQTQMVTYMAALAQGSLATYADINECALSVECDLETGSMAVTDSDYFVQFSATIDGMNFDKIGGSCEYNGGSTNRWAHVKQWLFDLMEDGGINVDLDNVGITWCERYSSRLDFSADVTFGGAVVRDEFIDYYRGLNWPGSASLTFSETEVIDASIGVEGDVVDDSKAHRFACAGIGFVVYVGTALLL